MYSKNQVDSRLFVWDGSDDMRCVTVVLGQIRVQVNAYCPQIGDLFKEYKPIPYKCLVLDPTSPGFHFHLIFLKNYKQVCMV